MWLLALLSCGPRPSKHLGVRLLVFVYGSLQRGEEFHHYLTDGGARFIEAWRTPAQWEMWDLDGYPALTPGGETAIQGEVYEIDGPLLERLDVLEETPELYQRRALLTPHGEAYIYVVLEPPEDRVPIAAGRWSARPAS